MHINNILKEQVSRIKISDSEKKELAEVARSVREAIESKIKRKGIRAEVFIGGSLAKNTLIKKSAYDIDIFLRFDKDYLEEDIKKLVKKIFFLFRVPNFRIKLRKIHGSRDYIQIRFKDKKVIVEVVPCIKVSRPENARNTTDLSYFHVDYVKKAFKKNKKLEEEVMLAKSFLHAQKCYGAESYIKGLSGYAIELLIIKYGSFIRLLKEISRSDSRIVVDLERYYKNPKELDIGLNKAKLESPIIIIDPTFKSRNASASLSLETYHKLKKASHDFLIKPDLTFFDEKKIDLISLKKEAVETNSEMYKILLKTGKQSGDIAGTKLKKFSGVLLRFIEKYFDVHKEEFEYDGENYASVYTVLKRKKEIINVGPRIDMKEAVEGFKKKNPVWYIENGHVKSAKRTDYTLSEIIKIFKSINRKTIRDMGVKKIRIEKV